ncbi:MAG: 3-deoxy-D-manno-octulosonic acid transferase [Geobacteraceae bacterium GWC2_58_44]|nr:MAG: 3-deoxy-D-manno-octulosonic acid transferase [Geobacteraceae bacterium GWC2_58_44]HBG05002.1 3-deoxy-D-manno-octulosonic acid transferase [Geobacter sp.]
MFNVLYNLGTLFLFPLVLLFHLCQLIGGKRPPALGERLGSIPGGLLQRIAGRPVIWVHAVSVGETQAARPLLTALRKRHPGHAILVSNTTATGRAVSAGIPEIDLCICFPFDFLPAVRRALAAVRPAAIVIMETEIWPNFTREAQRRGIPVLLANGRISDRSFGRYRKFSWFFRSTLRRFSSLCMQSEGDRDRIVAIGALPERTLVTGNVKHDIAFRPVLPEEKGELRARYLIPAAVTVICAGSTRPGEEAYLIASYRELLASCNDLFLVLAPRHPERSGEIAALLEKGGLAYRRRSSLQDSSCAEFAPGEVLLVDGVGELMHLYALSDLCFVGGSLVELGGHNLLEPASRGIPSIYGPHMNNFREVAALVSRFRAGIQIDSPGALTSACRRLIEDAELRSTLGGNALRMMQESGGATLRHIEVIDRYLASAPSPRPHCH